MSLYITFLIIGVLLTISVAFIDHRQTLNRVLSSLLFWGGAVLIAYSFYMILTIYLARDSMLLT